MMAVPPPWLATMPGVMQSMQQTMNRVWAQQIHNAMQANSLINRPVTRTPDVPMDLKNFLPRWQLSLIMAHLRLLRAPGAPVLDRDAVVVFQGHDVLHPLAVDNRMFNDRWGLIVRWTLPETGDTRLNIVKAMELLSRALPAEEMAGEIEKIATGADYADMPHAGPMALGDILTVVSGDQKVSWEVWDRVARAEL